jgi:hypothetical protein
MIDGNVTMAKFTVLLGISGIVVLAWSIGTAIGLWANPVFAPFFIISTNLANDLSYLGLSVGAFLLALSVIIYYKNTKTDKIFIVHNRLGHRRQKFYFDLLENNQQLINYNNENYPTVVMNGRRSELGKEEMENIIT